MEGEENKNLILSDGAVKFIEWRAKDDDGWFFDAELNCWTKFNWKNKTTQELYELWAKENGYEPMPEKDSAQLIESSEELWDKYSEHIDSDIDSLQYFSGRVVITSDNFKKLINELVK